MATAASVAFPPFFRISIPARAGVLFLRGDGASASPRELCGTAEEADAARRTARTAPSRLERVARLMRSFYRR
jgi:hypothetical protein